MDPGQPWLFPGYREQHMSTRQLHRLVRMAAARAGINAAVDDEPQLRGAGYVDTIENEQKGERLRNRFQTDYEARLDRGYQ